MSPRTKKQIDEIRINRKKVILDAALEVFAKQGYHAASISNISKAAGVSKGLMYNYFSSKEELLQILLSELLDAEMELVNQLFERPFTEDTFISLIKMGSVILKKKPKQWMLYFSMSTQPEVLKIVESKFTPERLLFTQKIIHFFKDKGHESPELQAQYFAATMTGFKISYIMSPDTFPIDDIEQKIINQFIKSEK